jgi:hypothetical protein
MRLSISPPYLLWKLADHSRNNSRESAGALMSAEGPDIVGSAIAELQNQFCEQPGMLPNALLPAAREVAAASDAERTWLDSVHVLEGLAHWNGVANVDRKSLRRHTV